MGSAKDLGPLDWRTPIVDGGGRPSPEFQRRWDTQRGNNALIGSVTLGSGAPTGTPGDGAEYLDTSTTPFTFYVGKGGSWHKASVTKFTELSDAPSAYTGAGLSLVRVKVTADGVEFATQSAMLDTLGTPAAGQILQRGASAWSLVTLGSVLDGISATQGSVLYRGASAWAALGPGTAGQVLQTGGAGANPSWVAQSGGGGSSLSPFVPTGTTLSVPAAASWTQTGATGVVATLSNLASSRGVNLSITANTSGFGMAEINLTGYTPPAAGTNFTITALVMLTGRMPTAWAFGLTLTDNTGKIQLFGIRNSGTFIAGSPTDFRFTSINDTSVTGGTNTQAFYTNAGITVPLWLRLSRTGTTFNFAMSVDGETWDTVISESSTIYLGATLSNAGLMIAPNAGMLSMSVFSFTHSP